MPAIDFTPDIQNLKQWAEKHPGCELLAANIASVNAEARTIDVAFYTGTTVLRYDFMREELYYLNFEMKKSAFDGSVLAASGQVLDSHSSYELSAILGTIDRVWWDEAMNRPMATMRFSKRADVEPVWQDVQDGIIKNVSMGVRTLSRKDTTPEGQALRTYTATKWQPFEISLVAVPADPFAGFLSAIETTSAPAVDNPVEQRELAETNQSKEALMSQPITPQATADNPVSATLNAAEIKKAERQRIADIKARGQRLGVDQKAIDSAIESDMTLEAATEHFFSMKIEKQNAVETLSHGTVTITRDEADTRMQAMAEHLLHRMSPGNYQVTELGRRFVGSSLVDMAKESLSAHGVDVRGKSKLEIAKLALHSTSDFPGVLANVATKRLRRAYDIAPRTWDPLYEPTTVPDFKAVSAPQLSSLTNLKQVREGGEYQYLAMSDGTQTYAVLKYGGIVGLTWEAMVNDDLSAFSRVGAAMAQAAARLESDLAWAPVTSNAVMGYDSVALFHASHGNLAASGAAIDVASVGAARAAMRMQRSVPAKVAGAAKTAETDYLNIAPVYIAAPPSLETVIDQFTAAITPNSNSQVNPFAGLRKIIEPRLTPSSGAVPWYLFADLRQTEIGVVARLEGESGLVTEEQVGFEVDGMRLKVRNVVGFSFIEHRGGYKNPGV